MATRSPYNDRYKVEQKGKTRRSASASKPKRGIADLTPADSPKESVAKKRWWAPASAPKQSAPAPVITSPRMVQLRRIWWVLWVASLLTALGILLLQNSAKEAGDAAAVLAQAASGATSATIAAAAVKAAGTYNQFVPYLWGVWAAMMGGAFYLEFVPIRKARGEAMAAAVKGGKPSKNESAAAPKAKAPMKPPAAPPTDDADDPGSGEK